MTAIVRNMATDPSFEQNPTDATAGGGTVASSTEWAKDGTRSVKLTPDDDQSYVEVDISGLTPGKAYTVVYTIRRTTPGTDGGLFPSDTLYPEDTLYPDEEYF